MTYRRAEMGLLSRLLVLLSFAWVVAPKCSLLNNRDISTEASWQEAETFTASDFTGWASVMVGAVAAAAAAAGAACCSGPPSRKSSLLGADLQRFQAPDGFRPPPPSASERYQYVDDDLWEDVDEEDSSEGEGQMDTDPDEQSRHSEDDDDEEGDISDSGGGTSGNPSGGSSGKLWGPAQFPEGTRGHAEWDWHNIKAAQEWSCPCKDRRNCIGPERIRTEDLLVHRKEAQTQLSANRRDTVRSKLGGHYNKSTKSFTRSFVVGCLNDCCAASCGLADGFTWSTWAKGRADLRKDKPLHAGRTARKQQQDSESARVIDAYIRDLRSSMEGSKGGSRGKDKNYTTKQAMKLRYQAYRDDRVKNKLPAVGNYRQFSKRWDKQENLVELRATGHAICDECTAIGVLRDTYEIRNDDVAKEQTKLLDVRQQVQRLPPRHWLWLALAAG